MTVHLDFCPHCGYFGIAFVQRENGVTAQCQSCSCQSMVCLDEAAAAKSWNRRPAPDPDAERWRALMSSERMTLMGWSGFDGDKVPRPGAHLHFTLNLWDRHTAVKEPERFGAENAGARRLLVGYVEELVRRRAAAGGGT